jgi:hypothetical protein
VIEATAQLKVAVVGHLPRKISGVQDGWETPTGPCPRSRP